MSRKSVAIKTIVEGLVLAEDGSHYILAATPEVRSALALWDFDGIITARDVLGKARKAGALSNAPEIVERVLEMHRTRPALGDEQIAKKVSADLRDRIIALTKGKKDCIGRKVVRDILKNAGLSRKLAPTSR